MAGEPVHVGFGFDGRMELPFLVCAHAIVRTLGEGRKIVFHALHASQLKHCNTYLERAGHRDAEFRFYAVDTPRPDMMMVGGNRHATFLRFVAPEVLPSVSRLLWIDCDTLVLRDVSELYDTALDSCAVAAVPNHWLSESALRNAMVAHTGLSPKHYVRDVVGLSDLADYFNAGVLLMDLDRFRADQLVARCWDFLDRTAGRRAFNDQDALNHVVAGQYVRLDPRWNFKASGFVGGAATRSREDPWILHFAGAGKPWAALQPASIWDARYWHEAACNPMFSELVASYLRECDSEGLSNLFTPEELLAFARPRLRGDQISAVGLAPDQSVTRPERMETQLLLTANRFAIRDGRRSATGVDFALEGRSDHLVYGLHISLPAALYEASFDLVVSGWQAGDGGRVVLEVACDVSRIIAQWTFDPSSLAEPPAALPFALACCHEFIEFRIHADGFTSGRLQFSGLRLRRRRPANHAEVLQELKWYGSCRLLPHLFRTAGTAGDCAAVLQLGGLSQHIVHGPYIHLPEGGYRATFLFALTDCDRDAGRVVIEVAANVSAFKAQAILAAGECDDVERRTLQFTLDAQDCAVEFRMFVSGYANGSCRFEGIDLYRDEN